VLAALLEVGEAVAEGSLGVLPRSRSDLDIRLGEGVCSGLEGLPASANTRRAPRMSSSA
jgi:hypothetical protein